MDRNMDSMCDAFEDRWKSGERPEIAEFLDRVDGPERSELLRELIQIELWWRRNETPAPNQKEYQTRFPGDHSIVTEAFELFRQEVQQQQGDQLAEAPREIFAALATPGEPMPATVQLKLPNSVPAQVGPFKILQPIGKGGMGQVYMAEPTCPIRWRTS